MDIGKAAAAFAALGLEGRLEIVTLLLAEPKGLRANDVIARLSEQRGEKLGQSTVSAWLRNLAQAGVLTQERQAQQIFYRIDKDMMRELGRVLKG